jgi:putative multicomponent Na+:H+ antiporter subunit B
MILINVVAEIPKSGELLLLPIELILPILGVLLIRTESPIRGLIYRSFLGSIAALIYAVVGAPDVALTEVLVGTLLSAILYIITIRACYTIIIIKSKDYELKEDHKKYIESMFHELHLQVKYLNLSFNEEEIDYDELMSSSTMAGLTSWNIGSE